MRDKDDEGGPPRRIGLRFTETMRGHMALGIVDDFERAARQGRADGSPLEMTLTIEIDDVEGIIADPDHVARAHGTVTVPALSAAPMRVSGGAFQVIATDPDDPAGLRRMWYRLPLEAAGGERVHLTGFKDLRNDPGIDIWRDTTTLYATLHAGETADGAVLGSGIATIHAADLADQLRSFEVTDAIDAGERLRAVAAFGRFFAGDIFDIYGGVFARRSVFDPDAPPREKRPLRVGPPEVRLFDAGDGTVLRLTRYKGGDKGPVMLVHGLGVSSLAFAIDTIDTNLVEYLFAHGYDVWLLDYRASIELPTAASPQTADDIARLDWPAAVAEVQRHTGAESIQVVAHCYGAITFTMAMLTGMQGVRSAVCSQVGAHINVIPINDAKAALYLSEGLGRLGVDDLTMYTDAHADWLNRLYNRALALYPIPAEERCTSPVCHRVSFLYAPLYEHDQLNNATHDALHELFGVASIGNFKHLSRMVRAGHIVTAGGEDAYLPYVERLAIPITFVHGSENETWLPESTERTYRWLCERNGARLYRRHVIPSYGHIDCIFGRNAATDVYPHILAHLEASA